MAIIWAESYPQSAYSCDSHNNKRGFASYHVAMATETRDQQAIATGRTFVWHEVYGASAQASLDFYTKALGFGTETMDMGPMGSYTMLTKNGTAIAGVIGTGDDPRMAGVPPHWSTYLAVDDVDESLKACVEHGATVEVQPMDVPTIGRMALIKDPQGAHIWIFTGTPS